MILLLILLQFTPFTARKPGVYLEGNWQSCLEKDGDYSESSFEYCILGKCLWSFHMGPRDEFALFKGQDTPDHQDHDSKLNLLGPAYHASDVETWRGMRNWGIPSLGLHVNVAQAGGSRDECDSYFVRIERLR
jgi:hypothetical protein